MKLVFNVGQEEILELVNQKRIQPTNFAIPREEQHKLMLEDKLFAEDIYYRARFLDMLKNMPRDYELTTEELENINKWH